MELVRLKFACMFLAVVVVLRKTTVTQSGEVVVREICQWETFNASCRSDEVVVVTSAMYGRMQPGRCASRSYGSVGCSVDVLTYMSVTCSGRQSCQLVVPDQHLREMRPCPIDFAAYLETAYQCVQVTQPAVSGPFSCFDSSRDHRRRSLEIDLRDDADNNDEKKDANGGFLASIITDRTGAGSAGCPWLLRAAPWQRINVTLIDFSATATLDAVEPFGYSIVIGETASDVSRTEDQVAGQHRSSIDERLTAVDPEPHQSGDRWFDGQQQKNAGGGHQLQEFHVRTLCQKYAVVREHQSTSSRETVVCGDKARRKVVYLSASNEIEVELVRVRATDSDGGDNVEDIQRQPSVFLLRYDVIGCVTPMSPTNGWIERETGETMIIGCNFTRQRWYLHCAGRRWVGDWRNCSAAEDVGIEEFLLSDWSSPFGILVVSACGVALGLVSGTCLLTILLLIIRRKRHSCFGIDPVFMSRPSSSVRYGTCTIHHTLPPSHQVAICGSKRSPFSAAVTPHGSIDPLEMVGIASDGPPTPPPPQPPVVPDDAMPPPEWMLLTGRRRRLSTVGCRSTVGGPTATLASCYSRGTTGTGPIGGRAQPAAQSRGGASPDGERGLLSRTDSAPLPLSDYDEDDSVVDQRLLPPSVSVASSNSRCREHEHILDSCRSLKYCPYSSAAASSVAVCRL